MLKRLHDLTKQGVLRQLDYQFAKFVALRSPDSHSSLVALVAALVSHELGKGHVCLMLNKISAQSLFGLPSRVSVALLDGLPEPEQWTAELNGLPIVSNIEQGDQQATPLVLDGGRLYLHRYWHFEQLVACKLHHTAQPVEPAAIMSSVLNELFPRTYTYLYQALQQLKKVDSGQASPNEMNTAEIRRKEVCDKLDVVQAESLNWDEIDAILIAATKAEELSALDGLVPQAVCLNWQKVAAAMAITRQFAVISGGPGTGKTTTVAKLLAALVMQADHGSTEKEVATPNIKLVAPTGKAAARLTESIGMAVQSLPVDPEVRKRIPTQSSTIHRLLGSVPNQVDFRHHHDNPLHLDVLVVDEASMVDLPMMARLLDAMPPHAKLILLGDRDQLASVEAGAVLGDICAFSSQGYSRQQEQLLSHLTGFDLAGSHLTGIDGARAVSPVADSLCMLQKSYRFHAESGIGKLAKAINNGNPYHVEKVCQHGFKDINHYSLSAESYQTMINMTVNFYRDYFDAIELGKEPKEVLKAFSAVRLLCALREGDFGVVGLNHRIERELVRIGKVSQADETWYEGRPIMITRNDHGLGLYNGDIGIAMIDKKVNPENPHLRVFFEMPDGSIRSVLPSRLPEHETVYAMTIHKSQGSEFADTLMVLPSEFSPILTRELIYTGVTRAKEKLYLFALQDVINRSVRLRTERASGLACLLG